MKTFKEFVEEISYRLDDNLVLEMGNMQPKDTGLHPIVRIMHKGGAKHGPRVKVSNIAGTFHHKDNFTITSERAPRILGNCKLKKSHVDDIIDWVKLNHVHIHKVWNDDSMSPSEVENGFKKV